MATAVETLKQSLLTVSTNPALMVRNCLDMLDQVSNGTIEMLDASEPLVYAIQSACVASAATMDKDEAICRRRYPSMALEDTDLYFHMSDRDYLGRFSSPSKATFYIALDYDEVLQRLVMDTDLGYSKLIIPRNSTITIAGLTFTFEYPLEIRQLAHGGMQVVYDTSMASPVQTLETNLVPWGIHKTKDVNWLAIQVELTQVKIKTATDQLTRGRGFRKEILLDDMYYFARVYNQLADGSYQELYTTHSDQIYDNTKPTALLQVLQGRLIVKIPQIYMNNNSVYGKVRVDVYETKGPVTVALGAYPEQAFVGTWKAIDMKRDFTKFSAPMPNIRTLTISSDSTTYGGAGELSFEDLRKRVTFNATGVRYVPITPAQRDMALENNGFQIVKSVDNLTDRIFLATRQLPSPRAVGLAVESMPLITAASASIETMNVSMMELAVNEAVIDNGESLTITPDAVFQLKNGRLHIVPGSQVLAILNTPVDERAVMVSRGNYLFTPFYYVVDTANGELKLRAYYLDSPEIKTKTFEAENQTTLLQIGVDDYNIVRDQFGYIIEIKTKSSDEIKMFDPDTIHVQLAFTPHGEKNRAYLNGERVFIDPDTKEYVYQFRLTTTHNVDANNGLEFTTFKMFDLSNRKVKASLTEDFDVIFSSSGVMPDGWKKNVIDTTLGKFLLPDRIAGINHEVLKVKFGDALEALWTRARNFTSSATYRKYGVNVPARYEKDVYDIDPTTGSAIDVVDGELVYHILHKAGDPVLDANGNQIFKHRADDIVYDSDGTPIIEEPRHMLRQFDLLMVEGAYYFATDAITRVYRQEMINTFLVWIVDELDKLKGGLLEKTNIYYYPKATLGDVDVMVGDGRIVTISAGQSLKLTLYVNKTVYADADLRDSLKKKSIETINTLLQKETISSSEIIAELRKVHGNDVIDHRISGLGGTADYQAMTVVDETKRCSLSKRLAARSDGTLAVEEDITIDFVRHAKDAL